MQELFPFSSGGTKRLGLPRSVRRYWPKHVNGVPWWCRPSTFSLHFRIISGCRRDSRLGSNYSWCDKPFNRTSYTFSWLLYIHDFQGEVKETPLTQNRILKTDRSRYCNLSTKRFRREIHFRTKLLSNLRATCSTSKCNQCGARQVKHLIGSTQLSLDIYQGGS